MQQINYSIFEASCISVGASDGNPSLREALARDHESHRRGGLPLAVLRARDCADPCEHGRRHPMPLRCAASPPLPADTKPRFAGHEIGLRPNTNTERKVERLKKRWSYGHISATFVQTAQRSFRVPPERRAFVSGDGWGCPAGMGRAHGGRRGTCSPCRRHGRAPSRRRRHPA
jgi:hypothetical protein